MASTLEKVRRLEAYIESTGAPKDVVLEMTLDKLLHREEQRLRQMHSELRDQIQEFEQEHGCESSTFVAKYNSGQLGDDIDFIESNGRLLWICSVM